MFTGHVRTYAGVVSRVKDRMQIGKTDVFERNYMEKFRLIAAQFGEFVEYERDRAARDIGLHLTSPKKGGGEIVLPALAWFQLKGIQKTTVDCDAFDATESVSIRLSVQHLQFWYINPEPTYLVVYVECVDKFYVTNIKKYLREKFGDSILKENRATVSIEIEKQSVLDHQAFFLIMTNKNIEAWKERIHENPDFAGIFFRDSSIIKRLDTATARNVSLKLKLVKYISKTRTEVSIIEISTGKQDAEIVYSHWQAFMPDVEVVFPYLKISPQTDVDDDDMWWDDEINTEWPALVLSGGREVRPSDGYEMVEYSMDIELNDIGKGWAETLDTMEKAGFIDIDLDTATFVSVARWHARDV